jgi:hypothetical protein
MLIGNAVWPREVKQGEDDIDAEFQSSESEREFLPARFNCDMIGVAEVIARCTALDDLNSAVADAHGRVALFASRSYA